MTLRPPQNWNFYSCPGLAMFCSGDGGVTAVLACVCVTPSRHHTTIKCSTLIKAICCKRFNNQNTELLPSLLCGFWELNSSLTVFHFISCPPKWIISHQFDEIKIILFIKINWNWCIYLTGPFRSWHNQIISRLDFMRALNFPVINTCGWLGDKTERPQQW